MRSEIGRKLLAHDLKTETVVWLKRPNGSHIATMWVATLGPSWVEFIANPGNTTYHLLLQMHKDGTLADDTGGEIEVYEYLGEI